MMSAASPVGFFLDAREGKRYCVFHTPPPGISCKGGIVHVPPFGEEMNKSRRVTAMQARSLASAGFAVLQMDLFGCGDSSGELRDATWEGWKNDLLLAKTWVEQQTGTAAMLWAVRLGALLAIDFLQATHDVTRLVLWQPVLNGSAYLTQLLRMRAVSGLLGNEDQGAGVSALKQQLLAGVPVEIAGYDITPDLARALEKLDARKLPTPKLHIDWLEVVPSRDMPLSPVRAAIVERWRTSGATVDIHPVKSAAFWSAQEIQEAPELVDATCRVMKWSRT
jgi:exosortase A-associated hydrolase 2